MKLVRFNDNFFKSFVKIKYYNGRKFKCFLNGLQAFFSIITPLKMIDIFQKEDILKQVKRPREQDLQKIPSGNLQLLLTNFREKMQFWNDDKIKFICILENCPSKSIAFRQLTCWRRYRVNMIFHFQSRDIKMLLMWSMPTAIYREL